MTKIDSHLTVAYRSLISFFAFFKVIGYLIGNRVPAHVEVEGLDISEVARWLIRSTSQLRLPKPTGEPITPSLPALGEVAVAKAGAA